MYNIYNRFQVQMLKSLFPIILAWSLVMTSLLFFPLIFEHSSLFYNYLPFLPPCFVPLPPPFPDPAPPLGEVEIPEDGKFRLVCASCSCLLPEGFLSSTENLKKKNKFV